MPGKVSLTTLGRWDKEIGAPLKDALAVSMDICGRTGEQACRHALILMAQSARALTLRAKKNRKIEKDEHGKHVKNWRKGHADPQKLYKWMFEGDDPSERIPGTWENARRIGNRGLAKRSWMWGLARLKRMKTGKAIPGASKVYTIKSPSANGYSKENRLSYIARAMPAGWESTVRNRTGNKIMAQARNKLEAKWRREMGMPRRARNAPHSDNASIARYFLKGVKA